MIRDLLLATDLLPSSRPALRSALQLASDQHARATALYVLELWMVDRRWYTEVTEQDVAWHNAFLQREEQAVHRELRAQINQELEASAIQLEVPALVRDGRAADVIATTAVERHCGLIVIGTRRRAGRLGSVAEEVVRLAHCPILVVPADRVE